VNVKEEQRIKRSCAGAFSYGDFVINEKKIISIIFFFRSIFQPIWELKHPPTKLNENKKFVNVSNKNNQKRSNVAGITYHNYWLVVELRVYL